MVVVAHDTDVLVLLLHHVKQHHRTIILKTTTKTPIQVNTMQKELGFDICSSILFLHAITGCDTVSKPFGLGKMMSIKKAKSLTIYSATFLEREASCSDVETAGERALAVLFGCQDLNAGRMDKFTDKVSKKYVDPEHLPLTADAARFHSRRVYHQVQEWCGNKLDPTKWGWVNQVSPRGGLVLRSVKMELAPAPAGVLLMIRCKCAGRCDGMRCSCKKNGLLCTAACGQCKGLFANGGIDIELDSE